MEDKTAGLVEIQTPNRAWIGTSDRGKEKEGKIEAFVNPIGQILKFSVKA
jgi:hypothetical protein